MTTSEAESSLDYDFMKKEGKQKREIKKRMIDDEVLRSYD